MIHTASVNHHAKILRIHQVCNIQQVFVLLNIYYFQVQPTKCKLKTLEVSRLLFQAFEEIASRYIIVIITIKCY